jgi:DNA-binding winged helix-turn-helix (wHTH) protein
MLGAVSSTRFRFGPFELDGRTGELRKHGIRIRLPNQPSQILAILITTNRVVTREELR